MTAAEPCPCCGYRTLVERDSYLVCPVCCWEDDPEQAEDPWGWGGANGQSLVEAQQAFLTDGAVYADAVSKVRPARPDEARDPGWRPYDPAAGELHTLYPAERLREMEARSREYEAAFQAGLSAVRAGAGGLSDADMQGRVREFSDALGLFYDDAAVELNAHLFRDDHWPAKHPLRALAWAWRHRGSTSFQFRLSQLGWRPPTPPQ